ncbi:MAG: oligopeptide transporter, OPT family [Limisphaera sp.]
MAHEGTDGAAGQGFPMMRPFKPYIAPDQHVPELSLRAVMLGTVLGMVFGASSLYLVLKVGLTVSASIPVAVISLALFRLWSKAGGHDATILEHNVVQTAGSAGESIAFGLGVTMPAILILGFDLELSRVMLVAVLGGLLGILMMIPLRRALIVAQHGVLKYPEGTACAEVLKAGVRKDARDAAENAESGAAAVASAGPTGGLNAATVFAGFGVGLLYKTLMSAFKLWKDVPERLLGGPLRGGSVGAEISPELLGVGYIIGPRIAGILMAGGALSYLLLMPMIRFFAGAAPGPVPPGTIPVAEMTPNDLRGAYILYIGAGAVAAGGIISLLRSWPLLMHGIRSGLSDLSRAVQGNRPVHRTERDLPMTWVLGGIAALIVAILLARPLHMNLLGAVLIVLFGFLFVTVSSRLTGEIGSSSNPISGMTVATLLLTCLIFLSLGWTEPAHYVTALSVGGIVCIAASNGGTTSQDLKTGFLLGATPRAQQVAILIGATASALLLGPILLRLNEAATVYVPAARVAPGLQVPADAPLGPPERLTGPQGRQDPGTYRGWHKTSADGGPPGKYLVNDEGRAVWYVDPGINGRFRTRPDGSEVQKFDAPKATLMSYIIKGVLDRELPWGLVLFGVMIAAILELCGVSSLAFAVGVYLPISASTPIFVGGLLRAWVDRCRRRHQRLSAEEAAILGDRSPGVLLASGYIAGGAIAGIGIAFLAGLMTDLDRRLSEWAAARNPFYGGPAADWLALLPFLLLASGLVWVERRALRRTGSPPSSQGVGPAS